MQQAKFFKPAMKNNNFSSATILVNNESNKETRRLADLNVDSLSDIIPIIKAYLAREEQEGL